MEFSHIFTLEEANTLLPEIVKLVQDLQAARQVAEETRLEFKALPETHARGNGYEMKRETLATRITEKMREIKSGLEAIQKKGGIVKDIEMGLVDFPGERNGEVVNLCWRLGEEKIKFWHSLDTGFGSREPL